MNRIFHRRVGLAGVTVAVFAGLLAVSLFTRRTVPTSLLAAALMVFAALAVERMVHTTYTVTADGRIVTDGGRLSKPKEMDIATITDIRVVRGRWLQSCGVLITTANGRTTMMQPDDPEAFVCETRKHIRK